MSMAVMILSIGVILAPIAAPASTLDLFAAAALSQVDDDTTDSFDGPNAPIGGQPPSVSVALASASGGTTASAAAGPRSVSVLLENEVGQSTGSATASASASSAGLVAQIAPSQALSDIAGGAATVDALLHFEVDFVFQVSFLPGVFSQTVTGLDGDLVATSSIDTFEGGLSLAGESTIFSDQLITAGGLLDGAGILSPGKSVLASGGTFAVPPGGDIFNNDFIDIQPLALTLPVVLDASGDSLSFVLDIESPSNLALGDNAFYLIDFTLALPEAAALLSTADGIPFSALGIDVAFVESDVDSGVPTNAAPIPLPAAAWLLVTSLAALGFVGRRRV